MSRRIPKGATVIATLTRCAPDVEVPGVARWTLDTDAGPGLIASAIMQELPNLMMPLPHRVMKGNPVTLLLHVIFPGRSFALAMHVAMKESIAKPELYDTMCTEIVEFVEHFITIMPAFFDALPIEGAPMRNAPTSDTPQ